MRFTKMHGLGNDYLYFYGDVPENVEELAVKLSDRHFGVGSDGLIYISPSSAADFKMRIFNADGSEAMMCGNGIRCVGKYVYDKGYTDRENLTVETLSGIRTLQLHTSGNKVRTVTVGMGTAEVSPEKKINVSGREILLVPVSVGNPHAVIFVEDAEKEDVSGIGALIQRHEEHSDRSDVESIDLSAIGPLIEHHEAFPGGVNVEFVQVLPDGSLRMRVWERGSGITMACGTGACASAAAAVSKGFAEPDSPVRVRLDGGDLTITVHKDGTVLMDGPAEAVFEGEIE